MAAIVVAGSRDIDDYAEVSKILDETYFNITTLISGTARGVDRLGERWAKEHNILVQRVPADWAKYGRSAGYRRNEEMARLCEGVLCIWDGKSNGTFHMMQMAKKYDKPLCMYNIGDRYGSLL